MAYYCWSCYAESPHATGKCSACGEETAPPPGTSYADRLLWALDHPLPDRRMLAVELLGRRRERRAVTPLLMVALDPSDPYLAAEAVRSVVAIAGVDAVRETLERLAREGPVPARRKAARALAAVG